MAFRITPLAKTADGVPTIAQLAEIQLKAWLTVPLYALIYPGPPSTHPTVVRISRERHETSLLNDPTCEFLVARWKGSSSSTGAAGTSTTGAAGTPTTSTAGTPNTGTAGITGTATTGPTGTPTTSAAGTPTAGITGTATTGTTGTATTGTSATTSWSSGANDETETGQAVNIALASSLWESIVATRRRHSERLGAHVSIDILATLPEYQGRGAGRQLLERVVGEADALGLASVLEASQEGLRLYSSVGEIKIQVACFVLSSYYWYLQTEDIVTHVYVQNVLPAS
ncbi:hypothetical protein DV736_g4836, partial [Chaetothyriales sp. CBS 134916]